MIRMIVILALLGSGCASHHRAFNSDQPVFLGAEVFAPRASYPEGWSGLVPFANSDCCVKLPWYLPAVDTLGIGKSESDVLEYRVVSHESPGPWNAINVFLDEDSIATGGVFVEPPKSGESILLESRYLVEGAVVARLPSHRISVEGVFSDYVEVIDTPKILEGFESFFRSSSGERSIDFGALRARVGKDHTSAKMDDVQVNPHDFDTMWLASRIEFAIDAEVFWAGLVHSETGQTGRSVSGEYRPMSLLDRTGFLDEVPDTFVARVISLPGYAIARREAEVVWVGELQLMMTRDGDRFQATGCIDCDD